MEPEQGRRDVHTMELGITSRYAREQAELCGNKAALEALAEAFVSGSAVRISLAAAKGIEPAPFEGFLRHLEIRPSNGRIKIAREGKVLTIDGAPEWLQILAENIASLWLLRPPTAREHLHIEFYDGHPFLDRDALPLTVVLP